MKGIFIFLLLGFISLDSRAQAGFTLLDSHEFDYKLVTVSGDTLDFSTIKSKYIILDFFFMACGPCKMAAAELKKLDKKYDDSLLTIVGMNVKDTKTDEIKAYMERNKILYQVCIGAKPIARKYGAGAYPFIILLDQKRNKVWYTEGFYPDFSKEIKDIIDP